MNIGFIAHDSKKHLMQNFCIAYRGILSKHEPVSYTHLDVYKRQVISGGGLVGIVTDVGKDYAKVRAIIDDESSVSVSFANTSDTGIVRNKYKIEI